MRWIAGIVILIATAIPVGAQAPPAQKTLPDYYPAKAGAKWTYDLDPGNGRKIRVTNQITRIETINGKAMARLDTVINGRVIVTQHLLSTPEGVFRCRLSGSDVSPPLCFLKYPFKEGEAWKAEPVIGNEHSKMSFKSGSHEELKSAAAKYQAISVACEINADRAQIKIKSWYAPDIGMVKDVREFGDTTVTMELVSFEAGR